jgi:uncharacterized membrane protein
MGLLRLAGGALIGAAAMYLLDPESGNRRRALVRDKAVHAAHRATDAAETTARDLRNRTQGVVAMVAHGRVDRFGRPELLQKNWSPTARLLSGAGGGALAVYGAARRDLLGAALGMAGAGLLARAATNMDFSRLTGIGAGRGAITIQKTINIAVPPEQAYDYWANPERLPRVLSHVKEVRQLGDRTYHWVVEGPGSIPVEWDAEVTEDVPGQYISWRTLPGSAIGHQGSVRFEPTMDGTRITVRLSYNPVAGGLGHLVASLLGADPKTQLDDDLLRLKTLLEGSLRTKYAAG